MLKLTVRVGIAADRKGFRELVLSYAERSRSRLRSVLEDGSDVGLILPRGTTLRDGDVLQAESGECIRVRAAVEPLYRVTARDTDPDPSFSLLRAAYHLGNRHVPLALSPEALLLEPDPVLREMLQGLGVVVSECSAGFDPEPGAYGGGHRHDHDPAGGSLGELLSQQAHAARVPDFGALQFHR